jgi:exodeoxyribonuclease-3
LDVYDPARLYGSVCYHPEEHHALQKLMAFGFIDIYRKHKPDEKEFTFWDYRIPNAVKRGLGWRIDHIMATNPMAEKSTDAWIDKSPRLLPKPSDHTFIVAEFKV